MGLKAYYRPKSVGIRGVKVGDVLNVVEWATSGNGGLPFEPNTATTVLTFSDGTKITTNLLVNDNPEDPINALQILYDNGLIYDDYSHGGWVDTSFDFEGRTVASIDYAAIGNIIKVVDVPALIPVTPYFRKAGNTTLHRLGGIDFRSPPPPPTPYLTFQSASPFTLNVYNNTKRWNGALYYSTDTTTWAEWSGTTTLSSGTDNKLYLRGAGNTIITGSSNDYRWVLTGTAIECVGNIENLLDWETVALGGHPTMISNCYRYMFYDCTSLTTAPALPATTLADNCYYYMFRGCTSLTTAPALPATTLANSCYRYMFDGCTSLTTAPALPATTLVYYCYGNMFRSCSAFKVSATQTGSYQYAWRIPTSGTGTTASSWNTSMLTSTGGTFTYSPVINTTYYVENPPV